MNEEVIKQINANIKSSMKEKGFKKEGLRYLRIVNGQIFQSVGFQGYSGGDRFTLNIGLSAICDRKVPNYKYFPDSIRIGLLLGKGDTWWEYTDRSVETITDIILNFLLPLFDRCDTYQGFYDEIKNEITSEPYEGFDLTNGTTALYILTRGRLHWLCIKVGAYDDAVKCLKSVIHIQEDNSSETAVELRALVKRIENNDVDSILNELEDNEASNLICLKKYVANCH